PSRERRLGGSLALPSTPARREPRPPEGDRRGRSVPMRVMFIHPGFPAQFGLVAHYLSTQLGWPCTFVTSVDTRHLELPFTHVNYRLDESQPQPKTFVNPENVEGLFQHLAAIYRGLRNIAELRPDLVVGHMS